MPLLIDTLKALVFVDPDFWCRWYRHATARLFESSERSVRSRGRIHVVMLVNEFVYVGRGPVIIGRPARQDYINDLMWFGGQR
jgi:hypothetical protein